MAVRNLFWHASNESRYYPFDTSATLQDDDGRRPPLTLLAGMKVLVPQTLGQHVYLGALAATRNLISAVLLATDDLDLPGTPVATISQRLPVVRHYPYAVRPAAEGVGGWIAFGAVHGQYAGRFSTPRQALLAPLAARGYRVPPIPSVRKQGAAPLAGLVRLAGGNDIEIVKECREVPGHVVADYHEGYCGSDELGTQVRDVVVIRLKNKSQTSDRNVLAIYSGPCSKRPASGTCDDPQPIEFLGPVAPDEAGRITVQLRGCLDMLGVRELVTLDEDQEPVFTQEACGVVLSCGLALEDACVTSSKLPDAAGVLPSEDEDLCEEVSFTSVPDLPIEEPSFEFDEEEAESQSEASIVEDFSTADDWLIRFGHFVYESTAVEGGQVAMALVPSSSSRNVATFEAAGLPATSYYRKVQARVQLAAEPVGSLHNAAVVANYQDGKYFVAEIDWDGHYRGFKLFRVARFDGSRWLNLFSVAAAALEIGKLYDISLEVYPHQDPTDAWLVARVQSALDDSLGIEIGPLAVSDYGDGAGRYGIGSNRSEPSFTSFSLSSVVSPPEV